MILKTNLAAFLVLICVSPVCADLLMNGSFESVPGSNSGQALMPDHWQAVNLTPDTYSNDGSYGLDPSALGNFTGVTAQDGIRWVAGASFNQFSRETFGQNLANTLTPFEIYELSAYLHQSPNGTFNVPGAYEVFLALDENMNGAFKIGEFDPTTENSWEFRSFEFTAPGHAGNLDWIIFQPYSLGFVPQVYPGIDNVSLSAAIPEPGGVSLLCCLAFACSFKRRRKRLNQIKMNR